MEESTRITPTIANTIIFTLTSISVEDDVILHGMMRRQRSAVRVAYNQFLEGKDGKEVYARIRALFPELDSYEASSIRVEGSQILASQKSLLPTHIEFLQKRLAKLEKKLKRKRDQGRFKKIKRLKLKLAEVETLLENDIVAPAIFGGQSLWKKVVRGVPGAKEEWRFVRTNQYFLSGDKSAVTGNQHFGLNILNAQNATLSVRITGTSTWIEFPCQFSENQVTLARLFAAPYYRKAVRLIRMEPGKYQVNITADEPVTGKEILWKEPVTDKVICGIDLNLDHLTATLINRDGQYKGFNAFKHPNLGELPKNKSEQKIFLLAKEVVAWCKSQNVSLIVLEDINIAQTPEQSATINRRTVSFSFRQLHDSIVRKGQRQGLNFKQVNPAYTSWIGEVKYQYTFGVSRHIAAAYVIARRGLGLKEALPDEFIEILPKIAEVYEAKNVKARADKTKERYNSRIATLRNWKSNSPKTTKHVWRLWAVLLNFWKEHKSDARASHARCGNTDGRKYLVSLRSSGGNTPPVLCLMAVERPPGQDLSSYEIWTTQGLLTLTSDTSAPLAAEGDGEIAF